MTVWAIQHIDSGTYLRNKESQIMLFLSPHQANNYRLTLPKPKYYAVVIFRR